MYCFFDFDRVSNLNRPYAVSCFIVMYRIMVQPVPDRFDFPKNEEEILEYWKKIGAFEKSLKLAKGRPRLVTGIRLS